MRLSGGRLRGGWLSWCGRFDDSDVLRSGIGDNSLDQGLRGDGWFDVSDVKVMWHGISGLSSRASEPVLDIPTVG